MMALGKKVLIVFTIVFSLLFSLRGGIHFSVAQTGNIVSGTINQDTTWTKANSPYLFTGNVEISNGTTLTIEPGVAVSLDGYFMNISGTLSARGSETEKITFTAAGISYIGEWQGRIVFSKSSKNSIIEYAEIRSSPNTIIAIYSTGTTTISSSTIGGTNGTAIDIEESSPSLVGNTISGNADGISINHLCSPIVAGNTIRNNTHSGIGITAASPIVSGNIITNSEYGIWNLLIASTNATKISGNTLSDNKDGIHFYFLALDTSHQLITDNLITGSQEAITIDALHNWVGTADIIDNTVAGNVKGVVVGPNVSPDVRVNQNNIYENDYNIEAYSSVDATNNWWGTSDVQAIKNKIISNSTQYFPFLTAPNPQAPSPPEHLPTPTTSPSPSLPPSETPQKTLAPSASPSITPSPTIPEFPSWIILPIFAVAMLPSVLFIRRKENTK